MAVGDELGVGVEDRVGAEVGREHVGLGHRDLHAEGDQVEVLLDQQLDRLVDRHPVGGPFESPRGDRVRRMRGHSASWIGWTANWLRARGPEDRAPGPTRPAAGTWLPPGPALPLNGAMEGVLEVGEIGRAQRLADRAGAAAAPGGAPTSNCGPCA